jgi:hypothetical protein
MTTPIVSALKKYYIWSFLEAPADFFKCFWVQVAVFTSETAARRFQK